MKKVIALALALCMVLALCACGSSSASTASTDTASTAASSDAAAANQPDIAVSYGNTDVAESEVIDSITYIQDTQVSSLNIWDIRTLTPGIVYEIYEMLYGVDDSGEFYPILADANRGSWMPGCDHEEGSGDYTIYIYDYITDSAGNHITANDVKFCFDNYRAAGFESGWNAFLSEEVVDDTTIILHCDGELNKLGELQNILCRAFIVSEAAYNASPSQMANDACGTGPYVLTEFVPDTKLVVTARDDYWQTNEELMNPIQKANIKEITLSIISEDTQKVIGLETGNIDIAEKVGQTQVDQLIADGYGDNYNVYSKAGNMIVYLYCNCHEDSICSNEALRKAILTAVDNESVAMLSNMGQDAVYGLGSSFYPDYNTDWEGSFALYQTPDEATIKALLDEAGYNGEPVTVMCANFTSAYAEPVQALLEQYGINVDLQILDGGMTTTAQSDPTEWDVMFGYMAADDYVVNYWSHLLDVTGGYVEGYNQNFIADETFQDMLHECMTIDGHTEENMLAFLNYVDEHAYAKGMCTGASILVYPTNMTSVVFTDKGYIVPGACTFAAEG